MIDGTTCDDSCNPNTAEWVELYNTCPYPVDISCWVLCDGDWAMTFPPGTVVGANDWLTIGGAANESFSPDIDWGTPGLSNYYGSGGLGTFTNSGEQVALFDASGVFIDGVI